MGALTFNVNIAGYDVKTLRSERLDQYNPSNERSVSFMRP